MDDGVLLLVHIEKHENELSAPKGLLAELIAQKEVVDFQAEIGTVMAQVMQEEGMINHEAIRKDLEEMPQEERADHLAFLGLCGLDPAFFQELVQTYLPRQW